MSSLFHELFRKCDAGNLLLSQAENEAQERGRPMKRWLATMSIALAQAALAAPPIEGTVTRVVDGDTLIVEPANGAPLTVRVQGIDAPEMCQPHGPQAKQALE